MRKLILVILAVTTTILVAAPDRNAVAGVLNLKAGFRAPPQEAKPLVWWDWVNGSVTKEGIKADLEDMKRAGIGGVQLFDVELYMPKGPVRYGTQSWYEHVKYAVDTAAELGLEFHVMNAPGWSASGGPWVTGSRSMKTLVWSETSASGGPFRRKLAEPKAKLIYRDVAVIAVPASSGTYRIPQWEIKGGNSDKPFERTITTFGQTDAKAIPPENVLNLTQYLSADGSLSCELPSGEWSILRFGYTSTGAKNHPAVAEGTGLEIDKLDPVAVEFQFNKALSNIIALSGPHLGKTFKGILFDSFEGGFQNWTEGMPALFKEQNGYDLIPWLPVISGRVIGSMARSEAVLYDFRHTIDRSIATHYFGTMQRLARQHGLITHSESQGGPLNTFECNEFVDVPMNEFWVGNYIKRIQKMKLTASSANLYGRRIVAAEAFTAVPDDGKWQNTPYSLKKPGDCAFASGINRFIFHTYIHQPYSHLTPGFTMGRYGTHFGRLNTWWKFAPAWIDYLSRSQFLLQQGITVTDIGFLFHNDIRYAYPEKLTETPAGYDYVVCYPQNLATLKFQDGRIVVPNGPAFKILMLPEHPFMSIDTLKHIRRFLESGATVVGNPPVAPPGLNDTLDHNAEFEQLVSELWKGLDEEHEVKSIGAGKLFLRRPIEEVAHHIGLKPDIAFSPKPAEGDTRYIHRRTPSEDIYFICNQTDTRVAFDAEFRVHGKMPELWDPASGNIWNATRYVVAESTTTVPIILESRGSIFVVFRNPLPKRWITSVRGDSDVRFGDEVLAKSGGRVEIQYSDGTTKTITVNQPSKAITLTGPWQVRFLDGRGAPSTIELDKLLSWSEHSDKHIRYYSGIAEYRAGVTLSKNGRERGERWILSLGRVCDIAQVSINGSPPEIVWKEPFQLDVTKHMRAGNNEVVIEVANRWINRLIGDEQYPADLTYQEGGSKFTQGRLLKFPEWLTDPDQAKKRERFTFTTWKHYTDKSPLVSSGLLGPVTLEAYTEIERLIAEQTPADDSLKAEPEE